MGANRLLERKNALCKLQKKAVGRQMGYSDQKTVSHR